MRNATSRFLSAAIAAVTIMVGAGAIADARPAVADLAQSHRAAERTLARCAAAPATPARWVRSARAEGKRAARARVRHVRARSASGLVRSRARVRAHTRACERASVRTPAPPAPEREGDGAPELPRRGAGPDGPQREDGDLTRRVSDDAHPIAKALERLGRSRLGDPYVWGAQGPSRFDCSGLTWWIYNQAGISYGRSSTFEDWRTGIGSRWTRGRSFDALRPGDMVYLRPSPAGPQHVGLYIGEGKLLHASSGAGKVIISDLTSGYYRANFVGWLRHDDLAANGARRT